MRVTGLRRLRVRDCYIAVRAGGKGRMPMRALVFTAPSVVELRNVDEPAAGSDDVIVDVAVAGICGSELHGIRTPGFRTPPLIMGHEFAGATADGRRVAVNPLVTCGHCDRCLAGQTELCRERVIIGVHRPGAFAERVAVPVSSIHDLPDDLSWTAAGIIEPVANAVHAWGLVGGATGQRVGIIGCGAIGLVCLQLAAAQGAASIVAADPSAERRRLFMARMRCLKSRVTASF